MRLLQYFFAVFVITVTACADDGNAPALKKSDSSAATHIGHSKPSGDSYCDSVNGGLIKTDTVKSSPRRVTMKTIGNTHIHIDYSSPGVKGRMIWGGLVAYGQVWVTGAHKATTIEFDRPVTINGKKIEAGKYGLFTIPGQEKWTIILNKNHDQHLADEYSESEDVIRVSVTPKPVALTPRLTYAIEEYETTKGAVHIQWEKLEVTLPVEM